MKLAIFSTHPIQYFVPIYKALAIDPDIDLKVYFASNSSVIGCMDKGFGVPVSWDIPLLEGYSYEFLQNRSSRYSQRFQHPIFKYNCPDIEKILRTERYDAVLGVGHSNYFDWQIIRAALRTNTPLFLRGDNNDGTGVCRPWWKNLLRGIILRLLYKKTSAGLAVGSYMAKHFLRHGMPKDNVFWSPHCVDNERFRKAAKKCLPSFEMRKQLGLENCDIVVLFCGKLIPVKNPLLLAEALSCSKERLRIGLLVVGDGALRESFQKCVQNIGLCRYAFVGFKNQSELSNYYNCSDVLVLSSSSSETWGLVVNEGFNFRLAAIVSDRVGCAEDLVIPGKTGYIFPSGDAVSLANIIDALALNPKLVKEMGANAYNHINKFSIHQAAAGITAALKTVKIKDRF